MTKKQPKKGPNLQKFQKIKKMPKITLKLKRQYRHNFPKSAKNGKKHKGVPFCIFCNIVNKPTITGKKKKINV